MFCNLIVNALIVFWVLFTKDRKDPKNDSNLDCIQLGQLGSEMLYHDQNEVTIMSKTA